MTKKKLAQIDYPNFFKTLNVPYLVLAVDDPSFTIIEQHITDDSLGIVPSKHMMGQPFLKGFPDMNAQYKKSGTMRLAESIRRVIKTGAPDRIRRLKYSEMDQAGQVVHKYRSVTHYPKIENENVTAVYRTTNNITAEITAERQLVRTEKQLNQALSGGSIGTWSWDLARGLVAADKNLAVMFGLDIDSAMDGLPLGIFLLSIHPDDQKRVELEIATALKRRSDYKSEYRTICQEGSVRWVISRGNVEVDEASRPMSFSGVVIDITERKKAENNLKFLAEAGMQLSASLDYKTTLNNIAAMVVPAVADWCTVDLIGESGQVEHVAVAHRDTEKVEWAKRLWIKQGRIGLSPATAVARVLMTGKVELYSEVSDATIDALSRTEEELALVRGLGITSMIIAPLVFDGITIGAMIFASAESRLHYDLADLEVAKNLANKATAAVYKAKLYNAAQDEIKKRKRLQKELQTLNNALEERVKERTRELEATNKGLNAEISKRRRVENDLKQYSKSLAISNQELQDFAYVASHDLQEPLRKIQAFGDILESEFAQEFGGGIEYLGRMRTAASRMSTLINDLLVFSRVSTKSDPPTVVSLDKIVREVVGDLETRIKETGGKVEIGYLPEVWAEPTHMRQLLQNLVGNALKFHRKDVAPVVKLFADPIDPKNKYYTIYIIDNGIGFEEKYLDRIFSVFQRLHSKDVYEGTGIGLAICRKIAEQYGGTITATSQKGIGSTFIFKIPILKVRN
ncbi:MAG: ATP-binding protein [Candidatus Saccharibacteria bacterium]